VIPMPIPGMLTDREKMFLAAWCSEHECPVIKESEAWGMCYLTYCSQAHTGDFHTCRIGLAKEMKRRGLDSIEVDKPDD
jgi:hypothetical protein